MLQEHSFCRLFRTTKYYLYFNLVQLVLSLTAIIALLFFDSVSTLPFQIAIILFLIADIVIRFYSDSQFIHKIINKIDLILLVLVVAIVTMEICGGAAYEPLQEVGYLIVGIRYGIQFFKQSHELQMMQKMGEISLASDLDLMQEIEGYHLHRQIKNRL